MSKPPPLTIGTSPHGYAIKGWEDFDHYARLNWTFWKSCHDETAYMTEEDRAKMMLAMYALEYERLKQEHADYVRDNPAPLMGPDGQVYRYKGP
jgi:hypothetical protein